MYRVFIRGDNLTRLGELDEFVSLQCWMRYNDVGAWELVVSADDELAALLAFSNGYGIPGIEVVLDGEPFFSGPVTSKVYQRQGNTRTLHFAGTDDNFCLRNRVIYPDPGGNFASAEYDVRTGAKETVIKGYVNYNAGPSALGTRVHPQLSIEADGVRGATVTQRARFDNLLEFIRTIAIDANPLNSLRFDVVQIGATLVFKVWQTLDLSDKVVFAEEFGTIGDYTFTQKAPKANDEWVGGSGTGTARVFREVNDLGSQATYGRIENFIDHASTNVVAELDAAGAAELAKDQDEWSLSANAIPSDTMLFGHDYNLGDMVSYSVGGTRFSDIVREVEVIFTSKADPTIIPKIGTPGTGTVVKMFEEIRRNRARLRLLERR